MADSLERLREIIAEGLCHRCGSCAGICPSGVIRPDEDYYPDWNGREESCTDCGLCIRVCTGTSFSFPEYSIRLSGRAVTVKDDHGLFLKAFLGYSTDREVRGNATSGGIATQIPLFLLRSGRVKGALVVGSDRKKPWKPRALVARSREEILEGGNSKYPACSMNQLWGTLKNDAGPFAFTGLPCHVHGLRKMSSLNRELDEKVALIVGLLCHSCLDHQVIRDIFNIYSINEDDITRVEYRGGKLPGYIRALTGEGKWVYLPYPHLGPDYYRPNAKECLTFFFKFYSPPRCRLCIDATSEYADISVGDPWFKGWEAEKKLQGGYSLIIARTERGLKALEDARDAGDIVLEPFPVERARVSHAPMVRAKRMRAFHNMDKREKRGMPVPDYGFKREFKAGERLRALVHGVTYFASDRPRLRRFIFGILLSRPGRIIVGAAFFRRRVLQAMWERIKRKLGGHAG